VGPADAQHLRVVGDDPALGRPVGVGSDRLLEVGRGRDERFVGHGDIVGLGGSRVGVSDRMALVGGDDVAAADRRTEPPPGVVADLPGEPLVEAELVR